MVFPRPDKNRKKEVDSKKRKEDLIPLPMAVNIRSLNKVYIEDH
jgi:hypothetical protein